MIDYSQDPENYLKATSIHFPLPKHIDEPPVVYIVFPDWKTATAYYNILTETYSNDEVTLRFNDIGETELGFDFIKIEGGKWITGGKLKYDKWDFDLFLSRVEKDENYVMLFGSMQDGKFVISGSSKKDDFILFRGYMQ